ncbi:hypothetical protein NB640_05520 [Oxalobacter vibrioformis]|uniref:Uncharacterized protein n=1 Tax=Oxalobacter vibrioformis TaxID=933080 RepID=A0A9E9M0U7_9BURK|nr:hypothetical protein [Oxalobacter vibrioformis]NLC24351.1 hypothetical protein [Oxalobacter sp.]WAW11092.1 hypothetical protein NB640_05520 [Oxalobacter vibrioformis]
MRGNKRVAFATNSPPVLTDKFKAAKMNELAKNPGIPVLTDILHSPEKKRTPVPVKSPAPVKPSVPAEASLDKLPWNELEERLTGRIRKQVIERLDFVLDDNLSQHVSSVLGQVVTLLADEIKHDMQKTLEVIVTHAISAELQQMKNKREQLENNATSSET